MLDIQTMKKLFHALNRELGKMDVVGEIGLCGGAVMCLVFKARAATKDVDAIFKPTREIREASKKVADEFNLPEDWLNDAAKGFFLTDPPKQDVLSLSHLRIWAPTAEYMLAMKCVSARFDTFDRDDVVFLIRHLEFGSFEDVSKAILKFYPNEMIPPKTRFLIEEIFDTLR
jgi:hypothetical protein